MLNVIVILTLILHLGLGGAIALHGHFFRAALVSALVLFLPIIWTLVVGAPANEGMDLLFLLPVLLSISLCFALAGVAHTLSHWIRTRADHANNGSSHR